MSTSFTFDTRVFFSRILALPTYLGLSMLEFWSSLSACSVDSSPNFLRFALHHSSKLHRPCLWVLAHELFILAFLPKILSLELLLLVYWIHPNYYREFTHLSNWRLLTIPMRGIFSIQDTWHTIFRSFSCCNSKYIALQKYLKNIMINLKTVSDSYLILQEYYNALCFDHIQ